MGRFSLRRNREDHTMDEDIEYYQPETGQTLQRSSLHNVGESESEAEGPHGGGGGGHRSVAEKLRRTSVDIGRRLAGKLRSNNQNVSRADSGLPSEADVRVLEAPGDTKGSGLDAETDGSYGAQRRGPANASVAAATASRGAGAGRRVSLSGLFAAAVLVANSGGGGGGGNSGGLPGAGGGASKLRSIATLFARMSVS
ncbi:hypothetical protein VaNZ11_015979, partial [Volvox africanus]